MNVKTTKASASSKKAEQQREKEFTTEDLVNAIKKTFKETKGRIDARYLWTADGVHRFRVNCWSEVAIQHSEFIHVIEEDRQLTVRRKSDK